MILNMTKVLVATATLLGTLCAPVLADEAVPIQQLHAAVKSFIAGASEDKEEPQQDTTMTVDEILSKQILSNSSPFIQIIDYANPETHKPPELRYIDAPKLELEQTPLLNSEPVNLKYIPDFPKIRQNKEPRFPEYGDFGSDMY
jgi:hypothetical protein